MNQFLIVLTATILVLTTGCASQNSANNHAISQNATYGYYTVKPGDTLIRIGMEHGQSGRDIARWNQLDNPNLLEVGQSIRVVPPNMDAPRTTLVAENSSISSGALIPNSVDAPPVFEWPSRGRLLAGFEELKNKGIDIGGNAGDPVLAAADGRVVYASAGLRGYGNLIILKHNSTYLTAYAHNQTLLVKEDQMIKRGQKIAEMGSSDADQVKLHFEIRRQGKTVDPLPYLSGQQNYSPAANIDKPIAAKPQINLDDAKLKCADLGFKKGTEGFGKCVLQLTK